MKSDNHPSNVPALLEITSNYAKEGNDKPINLFYDPVYLIKNVRNNLLERKRFLFPPFVCTDLFDEVRVAGGENFLESSAQCTWKG